MSVSNRTKCDFYELSWIITLKKIMKLLGLERHLGGEKKSSIKCKAWELVYQAKEKGQADKQINHQMMQSLHSK